MRQVDASGKSEWKMRINCESGSKDYPEWATILKIVRNPYFWEVRAVGRVAHKRMIPKTE